MKSRRCPTGCRLRSQGRCRGSHESSLRPRPHPALLAPSLPRTSSRQIRPSPAGPRVEGWYWGCLEPRRWTRRTPASTRETSSIGGPTATSRAPRTTPTRRRTTVCRPGSRRGRGRRRPPSSAIATGAGTTGALAQAPPSRALLPLGPRGLPFRRRVWHRAGAPSPPPRSALTPLPFPPSQDWPWVAGEAPRAPVRASTRVPRRPARALRPAAPAAANRCRLTSRPGADARDDQWRAASLGPPPAVAVSATEERDGPRARPPSRPAAEGPAADLPPRAVPETRRQPGPARPVLSRGPRSTGARPRRRPRRARAEDGH